MQINGKRIVPSEIGLSDFKAENIEDVQKCLITLDSIKCCQGAISCSKYPEIKSSWYAVHSIKQSMVTFSKIFVLFITMWMRQHSYAENIECKN